MVRLPGLHAPRHLSDMVNSGMNGIAGHWDIPPWGQDDAGQDVLHRASTALRHTHKCVCTSTYK